LLQPRWRGVCHGLLHERTAPPLPRSLKNINEAKMQPNLRP
jgi:hypothetical protein